MTITACGPKCDVGGEYILEPSLGIGEMHRFEMNCFPRRILDACDKGRVALEKFMVSMNLDDLPEGPIRRALSEAIKSGATFIPFESET